MTDDIPTNPQHEWQPTTAEYQPNLSGSKVFIEYRRPPELKVPDTHSFIPVHLTE